MKNYLLVAMMAFLSLTAIAQNRSEVEKSISEKYSVSSNDLLSITNKYGDVTINTWNKNEITVDVNIKAWAKKEEDAQELLERIEIKYEKEGNEIRFKTELSSSNWVNINNKSGFQINYTVNMPMKNALNLTNKYGAVHLADFDGPLNLTVGYGELSAGALSNGEVAITLKYSKGKIESVERGSLEFRYSSNITIDRVGEITLSDKYGGLSIKEAGSIDASIAYSGLKIGILYGALSLDAKYSGGSVETLDPGFKNVDVETSYGSFSLGVSNSSNFDFAVSTKYGNFKSNTNLDITKQIERNNSATYEGSKGSGNKGKITVSSSYGSVKFQ